MWWLGWVVIDLESGKIFFESAEERGGSFGRASTVRGQAIKDRIMQLILFSTSHLLHSSQDTYKINKNKVLRRFN